MPCVELTTSWQISKGTCDLPRLLRRTIGDMNRIHVGIVRSLPTKFGLSCGFSTQLFDLALVNSTWLCPIEQIRTNPGTVRGHPPFVPGSAQAVTGVSHGPGFPGPLGLLVRLAAPIRRPPDS